MRDIYCQCCGARVETKPPAIDSESSRTVEWFDELTGMFQRATETVPTKKFEGEF